MPAPLSASFRPPLHRTFPQQARKMLENLESNAEEVGVIYLSELCWHREGTLKVTQQSALVQLSTTA